MEKVAYRPPDSRRLTSLLSLQWARAKHEPERELLG
jgi:hypothetical protein